MRDRLIELIRNAKAAMKSENLSCDIARNMFVADFLIANGVTVQEWISVKDQEEPTENGTYLCHGYWFGSRRKQTETADFCGEWNIANNFILTHWMPLPQPPKGE